ncbi:MAG TPA: YaiO family outer membrane beta-barrel protein [Draconibacterium sp.]|nr:YaiO family outer membrane beta-barrel protein [Draconibacterium sp.]
MSKKLNLVIAFVMFLAVYFSGIESLWSQTLYEAQVLARDGKMEEARNLCYAIQAKGYNPDVALLIGRTYAWQQNYDSARIVISNVLQKYPDYFDAFTAIIDVEFWSGDYSKAIEYCNQALEKYKNVESLYLKKANILYTMGRKKDAVELLKLYTQRIPDDKETVEKLKQYQQELKKNEIRYTYTLDVFNKDFDRKPWQINSLEYKRETKAGEFIARINYAKRFEITGYQMELDAYPKLNKMNYFYLNYGNSSAIIFPKNRLGAEWFHTFPNKFQASAGMRLLFFENTNVDFYTLMLGRYFKNNLFSIRTFITPQNNFPSFTSIFEMRHFYANQANYLGVKLGYGSSPDELRNLIGTSQRLSVKSQWIRMELNHLLSTSWLFGLNFTLGREERTVSTYSGYYSVESRISFLF